MTKKQSRKTLEILCNIVNDILMDKEERGSYDPKTDAIIAVTPIPEFVPHNPGRLTRFISSQDDENFIDELVDGIFDTKSLREVRHEYHELQLDEHSEVIPRGVEPEYVAVYERIFEILPREIPVVVQRLYHRTLGYQELDFHLSVKAVSHIPLHQESQHVAEGLHQKVVSDLSRYRKEIEGNESTAPDISRITVKEVCDKLATLKRLRSLTGRELLPRIPFEDVVLLHKILMADAKITEKYDPGRYAGVLLRELGEYTNVGVEEIRKLYEPRIAAGKENDRYYDYGVENRLLQPYLEGYCGKRPVIPLLE